MPLEGHSANGSGSKSSLLGLRLGLKTANVAKQSLDGNNKKKKRKLEEPESEDDGTEELIRKSLEAKAKVYDALAAGQSIPNSTVKLDDICVDFTRKNHEQSKSPVLELQDQPIQKKGVGFYPFARDENEKIAQLEQLQEMHSQATLSRALHSINQSRVKMAREQRLALARARVERLKAARHSKS